jgi:hypothetical protein
MLYALDLKWSDPSSDPVHVAVPYLLHMAWPHINTEDAIIGCYQYDSKGEPTILCRQEGRTLPRVLRIVNYLTKLIYGINNKCTKYKNQSGQTLP